MPDPAIQCILSHVTPSHFSHARLCDPMDCSPPAPLSVGFSRQEYWSGLPFPSPPVMWYLAIKTGAMERGVGKYWQELSMSPHLRNCCKYNQGDINMSQQLLLFSDNSLCVKWRASLLYWNPTTKLRYCHPDFTDKLTFREIKSLRLCSWPPGCTALAGNAWYLACVRAQSHSEAERYTQACHWKPLMNACWFEDFSLEFGHMGKHHMVTTFQDTIFSSVLFNWMSNVISLFLNDAMVK